MKILAKLLMVVFVVFLAGCSSSQSEEGVTILGTVEQVIPNGWVQLEEIVQGGPMAIDTAEIGQDGTYKLNANISQPAFYRLNFNGRQYVTLILKGDETEVEVNADGNTPNGFSEVSGSYDTQYIRDMDGLMNAFQTDVNQLNQRAIQARSNGDVEAFQAVQVEYMDLARANNERLKKMVWESLPSLAAFYGVQRLDPEQYYTFFDSVSAELSRELPTNPMVMNLAEMVDTKRSLTIGAEAPEIALANPDGEIIRLTSLRGQYVLVDFWAAWCRPCRAENPNIVRAYEKYKNENFEVLQVSLDRTREAWLNAIDQDGLPWLHISDLKYWNSIVTKSYQINAIPASYLIDPDGKIIGKNLRGPLLEAKLKELFGQT